MWCAGSDCNRKYCRRMIGQTISHYRVLHKLGGGGMGAVYVAKDRNLGDAPRGRAEAELSAPDGTIGWIDAQAQGHRFSLPHGCGF